MILSFTGDNLEGFRAALGDTDTIHQVQVPPLNVQDRNWFWIVFQFADPERADFCDRLLYLTAFATLSIGWLVNLLQLCQSFSMSGCCCLGPSWFWSPTKSCQNLFVALCARTRRLTGWNWTLFKGLIIFREDGEDPEEECFSQGRIQLRPHAALRNLWKVFTQPDQRWKAKDIRKQSNALQTVIWNSCPECLLWWILK